MTDKYDRIMKLKIFVDSDDEDLKNKYREYIEKHNRKIEDEPEFIDAGFDLFTPENHEFLFTTVNKLDFKVICSAQILEANVKFNTGFYMYPRSSISKNQLRLANNVGIIDAGYRGHLIGMFDCIYGDKVTVNKFDRYLQIYAPGLVPILVEMVDTKEDLGSKTVRGDGGFGSTGI